MEPAAIALVDVQEPLPAAVAKGAAPAALEPRKEVVELSVRREDVQGVTGNVPAVRNPADLPVERLRTEAAGDQNRSAPGLTDGVRIANHRQDVLLLGRASRRAPAQVSPQHLAHCEMTPHGRFQVHPVHRGDPPLGGGRRGLGAKVGPENVPLAGLTLNGRQVVRIACNLCDRGAANQLIGFHLDAPGGGQVAAGDWGLLQERVLDGPQGLGHDGFRVPESCFTLTTLCKLWRKSTKVVALKLQQ